MKIRIGRQWLSLDTRQVEKILSNPVLLPVPKGPAEVLGLAYYQGQAVPVMASDACKGRFVVLLRGDGGMLTGLTVDEVEEKSEFGEDNIDKI